MLMLGIHSFIQVPYGNVTEPFLAQLVNLRKLHLPLTIITVCSLLIAHLQHFISHIFQKPSHDGTLFRCSEAFVRKFIKRALNWTICSSTWAGRKIPPNADEILERTHLCIAYIVKHEDIPSALIANSDQTQVVLAQGLKV